MAGLTTLYIVGGGGFGLEVADYLLSDLQAGRLPCRIGGVFDYSPDNPVCLAFPQLRYMGDSVSAHAFTAGEAVVAAVGDPAGRLKVWRDAAQAGTRLHTYVHGTAQVSATAALGAGCIICPNAIVNAQARLAENVLVNVFGSVGHRSEVGAHSVLSPYCSISGNAAVGRMNLLGTRATVFPRIRLGDACTVDAHSAVRQHVADRKIVSTRGQYVVVDNRLAPTED